MTAKLITRNHPPPIPDRRFDWIAYWDGEEETGHAGWGATKEEAIADLRRLDQERAECEGERFETEMEKAEWREDR